MSEQLEGGCACGAVRYRLKSPPMFTQACHCNDCKRQTGGAFVINALIETDRIELTGAAPVAISMPTDSGRPHDVYRCATCQTAVWSDYGRRPSLRFLRVGALDRPAALPPQAHIFTRTKLAWLKLPEGVPAFEIYYDMDKLWPAESLARRAALKV